MRGLLGLGRQPPPLPLFPAAKRASPYATLLRSLRRLLPASRLLRLLLLLAALSLVAPVFFHFRLRRFHRMRERTCGWIASPPMVCAHGGDSTNAFPNSMDAFQIALDARVDCVEVDVSRSSDGTLFALHDRSSMLPKPMRKGLASIALLTPWMIWKHRNSCVFDHAQPSRQLLLANIREEASLWARAGAKGLRVLLPTTWDVH